MNRQNILNNFQVIRGLINNPGKFQGEPIYVPDFWDMGLNGCSDDDNGESYYFSINEMDIIEYPELKGFIAITLWEDENGSVHHTLD